MSGDEKAKAEMYFIEQQVNNSSKKFIAHSPAGLFSDTRTKLYIIHYQVYIKITLKKEKIIKLPKFPCKILMIQ